MDSSNKTLLGLVGLPVVGLVLFLLIGGQSDKAKFDRLQIGMSAQAAQAIVSPRTGKYARHQREWGDNETLHLNGNMVLTIRNGKLVDKKWIGKEDK